MGSRFVLTIFTVLAFSSLSVHAQDTDELQGEALTRDILESFADAWRGQEEIRLKSQITLAFWISGAAGGNYHIILSNEPGAAVNQGVPVNWDIGFELNADFLRLLDEGRMGALTAMGQARASDPVPLAPKFGEAFSESPNAASIFRKVAFAFWTREWPPTVPFGEDATRLVHGGNVSALLYDESVRTAWYQLKPGMHINEDTADQINDFPQLIIVTAGIFKGSFDGQVRILEEGEAILIPAGMIHEFWAEDEEYGEFIWIAFGDGA